MKAVAETLGVARSNLMARKSSLANGQPAKRRGRKPLPDEAVVAAIESVIAEQPSYGYWRCSPSAPIGQAEQFAYRSVFGSSSP